MVKTSFLWRLGCCREKKIIIISSNGHTIAHYSEHYIFDTSIVYVLVSSPRNEHRPNVLPIPQYPARLTVQQHSLI